MNQMNVDNKVVHFAAGAFSGTLGSVITCPLDVAKTRLQSSLINTYRPVVNAIDTSNTISQKIRQQHFGNVRLITTNTLRNGLHNDPSVGFYKCIKFIVKTEGYRALFKGLVPTLIGVVPSRAFYFTTYDHCKKMYGSWVLPASHYGYSLVHLMSAASAGFVTTTATNPIWMIRTRLQLDNKKGPPMTTMHCIQRVYRQDGVRGFYKGLTASYFGISETAIHFMIYEMIKRELVKFHGQDGDRDEHHRKARHFFEYMGAAATSKTIATCIAYPHEVARTRMREEGTRYKKFWLTLKMVATEEGYRGLYRGLTTQLIKHIPNTAIVISTYEAVIYLCYKNGL